MIKIDQVKCRPITATSVEISWTLKPTDHPISSVRFTVLRSEGENGPFEDRSGPLVGTQSFVDSANLKAKQNVICWKIRVDDVVTGISKFYPEGDPTEAFKFHPHLEVVRFPGNFDADFIALEIVRRNNLLLRRFTGRLMAYCPILTQGPRCPVCFDNVKKRPKLSACPECFGSTFDGGYNTPISIFIDVNPSPVVIQLASFGKIEENQTVAWTSNYPLAKPNDMIVEPTNRRWRVLQVNAVTKNRYIVQQLMQLQEIDKSDPEFGFSVDLNMQAPAEDFVGFFPKKFSPKVVPTEGSGLL